MLRWSLQTYILYCTPSQKKKSAPLQLHFSLIAQDKKQEKFYLHGVPLRYQNTPLVPWLFQPNIYHRLMLLSLVVAVPILLAAVP